MPVVKVHMVVLVVVLMVMVATMVTAMMARRVGVVLSSRALFLGDRSL